MAPTQERFLDAFANWISSLGQDAEALVNLLDPTAGGFGPPDAAALSDAGRRSIAAGLTYVLRSLDLIPDGIDDIGYIDDAFMLRLATEPAGTGGATDATVERLAADCALIREFLGADYARLETYVRGLDKGVARNRSVDRLVADEATLGEFVRDIRAFARSYRPPAFGREEKNLVKLKAFFDARLPRG